MSSAAQELQLLLIRLCAAFAFLLHAAPKLFAGVAAREALANRLTQLGIAHALQLVVIAGLVELGVCLMLTLGYCTRSAAVLAALYLAGTAYLLPSHTLLWIVLCGSFAIGGGRRWSVDGWLKTEPLQQQRARTRMFRKRLQCEMGSVNISPAEMFI